VFNFDPIFAEWQCPELKKPFLVRRLFPRLIPGLLDQPQMNINENGTSDVLNGPADYTSSGLCDQQVGHREKQTNGGDQVLFHLLPLALYLAYDCLV
jgi:hypothetical protein